ncbi:hypothetical protein NPIL_498151 [Nephila pilipes]|uniref:Uncharacterized protein n=1 Tax=Nephila pilipes TaxID=299642 RepID=A0A8X6IG94_NEPPI|nr:hypothetical protein NPIL_498151 [Nephila pilipes]
MWKDENGVEFGETSGLGYELWSLFRRFEKDYLNWPHIMVNGDVLGKFIRRMELIRDEFVILPFWMLCDGLKKKPYERKYKNVRKKE